MRYGKAILAILLLLVLPLLVLVGLAHAQEFKSGDNVTVSKGQTLNSTLWTAGRHIDIAGTINGDVFCAGQSVNISATVNGDVFCAGQDVHISGPVNGDVRIAGQNVTVSSKVTGSLTAAGSSFSLDATGSVGRDASVAAADTTLNGTVARDFAGAGATITLASQIGRNVKASVDKLTLTSNAEVGGNLNYTSKNNAQIANGAEIAGVTHRSEPKKVESRGFKHVGLALGIYLLVSLLIIALVLVLLLPRLFVVVSDVAVARPWWTLLTGFLATLIFPMLFLMLLLTVVGIPLALLLLCAWMLTFEIGALAFSFWIGRLIFRGRGNAVLVMLVGALIVLLALMVPILGFFVFLAMAWWGIGMVLTALWRHFQRPSYALAAVTPPAAPAVETQADKPRTTRRRTKK